MRDRERERERKREREKERERDRERARAHQTKWHSWTASGVPLLITELHPRCRVQRNRGTSLIRKRNLLGPYCRPMPRVLVGS